VNEAWIVPSKLEPPTPPDGVLERTLLAPGLPLPAMTFLVAGPGYGKSLGLWSLCRDAFSRGTPVVWYSLDAFDTEVATFFHYLVAGVRRHIPQFGDAVNGLLTGDKLDPRLLWQRFFQELAAYNLPDVRIVLDDAHHLQEGAPRLLEGLAYFCDKLPPNTHLLLSSRTRLNLPLGRAQALGQLRVLGEEALRFTSEEEVEFMRRRAPGGTIAGIPAGWWTKATGLDGWPLGMELATAVDLDRELRLAPRTAGVEPLVGYVAEELYGAQPPELRAFMCQASLLAEPSPDACRQVFDQPEAGALLARLEADHLIRRLADGVSYRFPAYLREFLQLELVRTVAATRREEWHRRAATFHAEHPELALPHLIAAQDIPAAMQACEAAFPAMRFSGRLAQIGRWLEAFPAAMQATEPVLQLWQGHVHARAGRHPEADACYARALAAFEARQDHAGSFKVRVRQATIATLHEDQRVRAVAMLETLEAGQPGRDEDVADLHLARSLVAEHQGDMRRMTACNEAVLRLPVAGNVEIAASHTIAQLNLYTIALHQGALEAASTHIGEAVAIAERWAFGPYLLFGRFMQAHLRLLTGDIEGASTFLRTPPDGWSEQLDWHDVACAHTTLGLWHQLRGELKEADEAYRRSLDTFERAGFTEGRKVAVERLLWLAVARRQATKALELGIPMLAGSEDTIYGLALLTPLGRARHLEGDGPGACELLGRAVAGFEAQGAHLHLAEALLYLGASRASRGDQEAAVEAVSRGLAIAEERGYGFLAGRDGALWSELAPLVARGRSGVPFVEAALSQAAAHAVVVPASDGVTAAEPGARGLSVRCFGTMEVRLDGVLLDQWPRRKAKAILAALLLYPRGLSLGQLIELLGSESVSQAALTTMKVDVGALRRALEPSLGKGQASRFVPMMGERYVLDAGGVEFVDVRAFEAAAAAADRIRDEGPTDAAALYAEALRHYRANLLEDGLFARYFDAEREALRQQAVGILMWLAGFHQGRGDESSAEGVLRRAVELAPTDEEAYIALMRQQHRSGRPERIRQVYWDCRKALKTYLGVSPSAAFEAAYAEVARGA
jgi:ATP/maltotriose-dependent transcriptional regulator MalT/DNA-binding SARP family transcriptional activator